MNELLAEILAVVFLIIFGIKQNLTKEHEKTPPYARFDTDIEELVQQIELDKMFLSYMLQFREYLILAICSYVLAETVIDYFSRQFGG